MNPIAYCFQSKKPLLKELAGQPVSVVGPGSLATATAPSCAGNKPPAVGGFSAPESIRLFDTGLNGNVWNASAVGFTGAGSLTAYAYCFNG